MDNHNNFKVQSTSSINSQTQQRRYAHFQTTEFDKRKFEHSIYNLREWETQMNDGLEF